MLRCISWSSGNDHVPLYLSLRALCIFLILWRLISSLPPFETLIGGCSVPSGVLDRTVVDNSLIKH